MILSSTHWTSGLGSPSWPRPYQSGHLDVGEKLVRLAGLDLGQAGDPAALAVIGKPSYGVGFIGPQVRHWNLDKLGSYPLGTDYGVIIEDLLKTRTLSALLVDATGAKPFVDWLRREAVAKNWNTPIVPITIAPSAMHLAHKDRKTGYWTVPKRELVNALVVMEHKRLLKMDANSPAVKRLLQELRGFQLTITKSANLTFGAKQGQHDDLVMSLSMPCWWGLRSGKREAVWC